MAWGQVPAINVRDRIDEVTLGLKCIKAFLTCHTFHIAHTCSICMDTFPSSILCSVVQCSYSLKTSCPPPVFWLNAIISAF